MSSRRHCVLALIAVVATSCRTQDPSQQGGEAKDIATDLTPTAATATTRLYVAEGTEVKEYQCIVGLPAVRTNCTTGERKVALAAFETELSNGISQKLATAEALVTNLTAQHAAAAAKVADAQAKLAALATQKQQVLDAIKQNETDLAAANTNSAGLMNQISSIDQSVQTTPNADLEAQLVQLKKELKEIQKKQATLSQTLGQNKNLLTSVLNQVTAVGDVNTFIAQRDALMTQRDQAVKELADIKAESASFLSTMNKLKDTDLAYAVLSGDLNFPKIRAYVARFAQVMDKILGTGVPLAPSPGIKTGLAKSVLVGWAPCYVASYSDETTTAATLLVQCAKAKLFIACGKKLDLTFQIGAFGDRAQIFKSTGDGNTTSVTNHNDVDFYYSPAKSMGFAQAGSGVNLNTCDTGSGATPSRMCWHMAAQKFSAGYRCGDWTGNVPTTDNDYQRYIYQRD